MTLSFMPTAATLRERARVAMSQAIEALTDGDVVRWTNLKAKARELDARAEKARDVDAEHRRSTAALDQILGLARRDREKSA